MGGCRRLLVAAPAVFAAVLLPGSAQGTPSGDGPGLSHRQEHAAHGPPASIVDRRDDTPAASPGPGGAELAGAEDALPKRETGPVPKLQKRAPAHGKKHAPGQQQEP